MEEIEQGILGKTIEWAGESLILLPERAIFWPAQATLFVADLHLGKSATFRASGIPVPEGTDTTDLQRLTALVEHCGAEQLIVLGDLIHSRTGMTPAVQTAFSDWRSTHASLPIHLVLGNHDRHQRRFPKDWQLILYEKAWSYAPFTLRHEPAETPAEGWSLAGHIHPCWAFRSRTAKTQRFPCFVIQQRQIILPAFGSFTGMHAWKRKEGERLYALIEDRVIEL